MFKKWIVSTVGWILTLGVFVLTLLLAFSETRELFSSLTAAILAAALMLGTWVVVTWIVEVFKR